MKSQVFSKAYLDRNGSPFQVAIKREGKVLGIKKAKPNLAFDDTFEL